MNVIILGAGRVGFYLAKQLSDEGRQVTLIEKDPTKARYAQAQLDCMVLNDEGNNLTLLAKAGAAEADFFISVTESDEMNLLSCGLVSGEFQKPKTIARVRNYDYSEATTWDNPLFGIDHIINPEIEVAREITNIIKHGVRSNIMTLENSSLQIRNLTIDEESPFKHMTLQELRSSIAVDFIAPFLLRMEEYIIPTGTTRLLENDELFILASESGFEAIFELAHKKPQGIRKIAFVGGGNVACYLADYLGDQQHDHISDTVLRKLFRSLSGLTKTKHSIHFLEKNYQRCKYLTERYPNALVSHIDIAEEGFLEEGYLRGYDLLIATTGNQELNIISSMYAKRKGVQRVIALVNKVGYTSITQELGIDVAVSMNTTTVNSILKRIRKGNVRSIHTISESKFEIIELSIVDNCPVLGQAIKSLRFPKDSLILMVTRDGKNIIPRGDLTFQTGDHVVVISHQSTIKRIEELFSVL